MKHIQMTSLICSGCSACYSVCPKGAISFKVDEEGFKVPHVDEQICIDCGICIKTCPAINTPNAISNYSFDKNAYALQYHDEDVRKNSASGALFPAFANYFINTLHGYVCGCVLDEDVMPIHIVSNQWADVVRMQDSKYVQSDMCNCIEEIGGLLTKGKYVLFSGTSCQVAGVNAYLATKKISNEKLLTIDFFCHGVPSPMIWREYIKYYESKKKRKVVGYRFRNKKYGWGKGPAARGTGFLSTVSYSGIQSHRTGFLKKDDVTFLARIWPRIFFSNLCIRQYCHQCPYTNIDKPADITMGDFWGIEDYHPDFDDHKGCSLALVRSQKALDWLSVLLDTETLEVPIEEIIKRQGNAFAPSKPHIRRPEFWKDYQKNGITGVLPKYFSYNTKGRLKAFIKYTLFKLHIMRYGY